MSADLSEPLRTAIVNNPAVTGLLPTYLDTFPVFTRRPAMNEAPYPMIMISQDVTHGNEDGVNDFRPVITRQIMVYGRDNNLGNVRTVNQLSYILQAMFHRQRDVLDVDNWAVVDIIADGPTEAPIIDDQISGQQVQLQIRLAALRV